MNRNTLRHPTLTVRRLAAALALVGTVAACSPEAAITSPPPAPADGWLTVELTSPRSDDGAVQFQVTGPGLDSVVVTGLDGFAAVQNNVANLIVTGNVVSGSVARIHVQDLARTNEYRASVIAAAARVSFNLQDLTGYRAVLVR